MVQLELTGTPQTADSKLLMQIHNITLNSQRWAECGVILRGFMANVTVTTWPTRAPAVICNLASQCCDFHRTCSSFIG